MTNFNDSLIECAYDKASKDDISALVFKKGGAIIGMLYGEAADYVYSLSHQHTAAPEKVGRVVTSEACTKHGGYVTRAICTAGREAVAAMGGSSVRNIADDTPLTSVGIPPPPASEKITPEPLTSESVIKGCEISVNKDAFHYAWQAWLYATDTMQIDRDAALRKGVEAYLYHIDHYAPKPVPKSLLDCARAGWSLPPHVTPHKSQLQIVKAVLDAAGVKHHD